MIKFIILSQHLISLIEDIGFKLNFDDLSRSTELIVLPSIIEHFCLYWLGPLVAVYVRI